MIRHNRNMFCVTKGAASVLLANVEKEKEQLCIFLRVKQMQNAVHRRMNLKSFLHGKARDCVAVSWRMSRAIDRVIG